MELSGQLGEHLAVANALGLAAVIDVADCDRPVMVAAMRALDNHAVDHQRPYNVHYGRLIAAADIGTAAECAADLASELAVERHGIVQQLFDLRCHRAVVSGRAEYHRVIIQQSLGLDVADGLGFGCNSRAALITRGLAEMTRIGIAKGAQAETFAGLAGMGDLVLTCTGDLSRNRSVGVELGRGRALDEILGEMHMVAEGVKTTLSAWQLAKKLQVEVPIIEQMYRILYENIDARCAVDDLMGRSPKAESQP